MTKFLEDFVINGNAKSNTKVNLFMKHLGIAKKNFTKMVLAAGKVKPCKNIG